MADDSLLDKVHGLSDLELAVLLCLINREHVLMSTRQDAIDDLVLELQLVASKTFGLRWAVIDCSSSTTLDDFASALLIPQSPTSNPQPSSPQVRSGSYFVSRPIARQRSSMQPLTTVAPTKIANFVIAKNLDHAPRAVQIQALELLRTHRIFTRTSVQAAPRQFLFVPVLGADSGGEAHVTEHLNDYFAIAHWHDPEDGYVNLEEADGGEDDETASTGSVVKKGPYVEAPPAISSTPLVSEDDISQLGTLSQQVQVEVDVVRYQMNIVSFLRMHRAVDKGITPTATKHFDQLVCCLAQLHDMDFVTPGLVALAAKKIYLHRIHITRPEKERSMQWGSKLGAVEALLDGVGPEEVIEDVLSMVTAPL